MNIKIELSPFGGRFTSVLLTCNEENQEKLRLLMEKIAPAVALIDRACREEPKRRA